MHSARFSVLKKLMVAIKILANPVDTAKKLRLKSECNLLKCEGETEIASLLQCMVVDRRSGKKQESACEAVFKNLCE